MNSFLVYLYIVGSLLVILFLNNSTNRYRHKYSQAKHHHQQLLKRNKDLSLAIIIEQEKIAKLKASYDDEFDYLVGRARTIYRDESQESIVRARAMDFRKKVYKFQLSLDHRITPTHDIARTMRGFYSEIDTLEGFVKLTAPKRKDNG